MQVPQDEADRNYNLHLKKIQQRKLALAHRCQEDVRRYEIRKPRLTLAAARQWTFRPGRQLRLTRERHILPR